MLLIGWCVFGKGELLLVMVRLTECWVKGWWLKEAKSDKKRSKGKQKKEQRQTKKGAKARKKRRIVRHDK
jgi:hypothetical protein